MFNSRDRFIRKSDRNRLILLQSRNGLNYTEIARQHKLTPTRVRMITEAESRRERFEQDVEQVRCGVAHASILLSPMLRAAIAKSLGTPDFSQGDANSFYRGNFIALLKEHTISVMQFRELRSWLSMSFDTPYSRVRQRDRSLDD